MPLPKSDIGDTPVKNPSASILLPNRTQHFEENYTCESGRNINGCAEEHWLDLPDGRMGYLKAGSGPALILLHGLLGYSFSWRYTMPALAPYATVYAPDMLGAGFSDRPAGLD